MIAIPECIKKGDPKQIINFLKKHEPLSDEVAQKILANVESDRKTATSKPPRKRRNGFGILKGVGPFTAEDELKPQTEDPSPL